MRTLGSFPVTLAAAMSLALAACGGGGGGGATTAPPAVPVATTAPSIAPQSLATTTMALSFARKAASSPGARRPSYLSDGTGSLAFYDGSTLVYVANLALDSGTQFITVYAQSGGTSVTPGICTFTNTRATCLLTITTTIGSHVFGLIGYPNAQGVAVPEYGKRAISATGTPPTFTGVITGEGQVSVSLSPGTNAGVTLTMLGVAYQIVIAGAGTGAYNATTAYGYRIEDSAGPQIVTPGDYDNGPITITAAPAGIVTISPNAFPTPPDSVGDQMFNVTCINGSGGTVTISFNARTSPNTAYASGLTYSTANYSGATIGSVSFTCEPDSGTVPITVQGKRRR